jgi:hypothetical protein
MAGAATGLHTGFLMAAFTLFVVGVFGITDGRIDIVAFFAVRLVHARVMTGFAIIIGLVSGMVEGCVSFFHALEGYFGGAIVCESKAGDSHECCECHESNQFFHRFPP